MLAAMTASSRHMPSRPAGKLRVMVEPGKISDDETTVLAHEIRDRVEKELDYPGNIKITVIREKRAVAVAK